MLEWAPEEDCAWNKRRCWREASANGHDHVVAWLQEDASPGDP